MADRAGQQFGSYRLIRLLGRGGFADVYLGEHLRLGTQAAIKILHAQLASDEENSFNSEARTIANLVHPHIIRVLDFAVEGSIPFLVMDYAANGTLRQRYPKGTQVPLDTVVFYVKQVTDALQYAHDHKVIHRDIKPENMLLGRNYEVLLSDFGIATMSQSSRYQSTQDIVGTVAYMAPEQTQGKPRASSDQYSLGVVVYEWLSGDRPFQGSYTEIAIQHAVAPPPPLREKRPDISPEIEHVILTALEKNPNKRFATIRAFANALEQASSGEARSIAPLSSTSLPAARPSTPAGQLPPVTLTSYNATVTPPDSSTSSSIPPTLQSATFAVNTPSVAAMPPPGTNLSIYRAHSGWVYTVAWSPDGTRIVSGGTDTVVRVWNAATGSQVCTYHGHTKRVNAVAWSPDGRAIVSASNDKTLRVWEAATGKQFAMYLGHSDWVNAVAWSPKSRHIASGSNDKTVQIWDTATGSQVLTYRGHSSLVNAVAWSPDGTRVVSASGDKTLQIWNIPTGDLVFTYPGHVKRVNAVAWAPDGRCIVSASDDKTVQTWNATEGQVLSSHNQSHTILAIAWSPDGKRIALASYKAVHVGDVATGNLIFTYHGHSDWVRALVWAPDGRRIASASDDKTVQVWIAP